MVADDQLADFGSTYRTESPSRTIARVRPLFEKFGITRLANITGLDQVGLPTWAVIRPLARSLTVSQGKGLTHELAQASGVMESIELHHAEHFVPRGHQESLAAAARDRAYVHPSLLPIRNDCIPDGAQEVEWIRVTDLFSGNLTLVPRDLVDLDFRGRPRHVFISSSNGLASGNTLSEAILHGLCEVIERDQLSLWLIDSMLLRSSAKTRVRLESINDDPCLKVIDTCKSVGLEVGLWYITSDLQIPAFTCIVFSDCKTPFLQRAAGHGAHPKKSVALFRAISEALQSRLTHISGSRDDLYWSRYRDVINIASGGSKVWTDMIFHEPEAVDFSQIADYTKAIDSTAPVIDWVRSALSNAGLERALYLDLTQEEIAIPVSFVVVPGLEFSAKNELYSPGARATGRLRRIGIQ